MEPRLLNSKHIQHSKPSIVVLYKGLIESSVKPFFLNVAKSLQLWRMKWQLHVRCYCLFTQSPTASNKDPEIWHISRSSKWESNPQCKNTANSKIPPYIQPQFQRGLGRIQVFCFFPWKADAWLGILLFLSLLSPSDNNNFSIIIIFLVCIAIL